MAELMLEKSKKIEWLQKSGTPDALDLLGIEVEDLAQKAKQGNMKFKENVQVEVSSAVTGFADPLAGLMADEQPIAVSTPVVPVEVEASVVKAVSAPAAEAVAQTAVVAETPKTKSADEIKADETRELVDALQENLINPVVEAMADMQSTIAEQGTVIKSLQAELVTLKKELQVQGLQIQEETLPKASSAALIKEYINKKLNPTADTSNTFGKSVDANDPILGKKPAESKVKDHQAQSDFAGFLDGN